MRSENIEKYGDIEASSFGSVELRSEVSFKNSENKPE